MRQRPALGWQWAFSDIRLCRMPAVGALRCANVQPSADRRLTQDIRFDLMACHEGDFRLLKAGGSRIEWYRYGDSNPGILTENQVS